MTTDPEHNDKHTAYSCCQLSSWSSRSRFSYAFYTFRVVYMAIYSLRYLKYVVKRDFNMYHVLQVNLLMKLAWTENNGPNNLTAVLYNTRRANTTRSVQTFRSFNSRVYYYFDDLNQHMQLSSTKDYGYSVPFITIHELIPWSVVVVLAGAVGRRKNTSNAQ